MAASSSSAILVETVGRTAGGVEGNDIMKTTTLLVILNLLLAVPPVAAVETLGTMEASAYEAVPPEVPMRVRPMANSALERDLIAVFQDALQKSGYAIVERDGTGQGAYVFSFRVTGEVDRERPQSRLQLEGQGGSRDAEDLALTLRWKVGKDRDKQDNRPQLLLVRLSDPSDHVVWEARVALRGGPGNSYDAVSGVAAGVVMEIGRDVIGRQLP